MTLKVEQLAMPAVYSYLFPEMRELVRAVEHVSPRLYLTSTPATEATELLQGAGLKDFDVPATPQGTIDLDAAHEPLMERIINSLTTAAPGLDGYTHTYPLAGSSPGIFHYLAEAAAKGHKHLIVRRGEYEGFGHYARACGMTVTELADEDIPTAPPALFFVSDPSACNGHRVPAGLVDAAVDAGHEVVVDLAYLGTDGTAVDVTNPGIAAVVASMSKPWGLFRFRTGLLVARQPVESLFAQKWFKDFDRVVLATLAAEKYPPGALAATYRPIQEMAVEILATTGVKAAPSPAFLLAHAPLDANLPTEAETYKRTDVYRFCLTPTFELIEAIFC